MVSFGHLAQPRHLPLYTRAAQPILIEKTHGYGWFDLPRLLKAVGILNDSRRLSFVTDRDCGQGEQSVMNGRNAGFCAFVTQVTDESGSVTYAHCDSPEQDGSAANGGPVSIVVTGTVPAGPVTGVCAIKWLPQ
jgi:hypothetical protein